MPNKDPLDISIILATYNSAKLITGCMDEIRQIMDSTRYAYEIIVVDDKSEDHTVSVVQKLKKEDRRIHLLRHRKNHGRGKTVSDGFRRARGRIVGYIDVDLDHPAFYIYPLIVKIDRHGVDICTARRFYAFSLNPYLLLRQFLSRAYSFISQGYLGIPLKDTETGLKFFKKSSILEITKEVKSTGWFWDTEVMVRGYVKGLAIEELPSVFIRKSSYSTVRLLSTIFHYLWHLRRIKQQLKKLGYPGGNPEK